MKSICSATLLCLSLLTGCGRHEQAANTTSNQPPVVARLATVQTESLPQLTEITGTLRPSRRAVLAAKVMGSIIELPASLGQVVRSGELLLKISASEIDARVIQVRAQLNIVRRDLERERLLLSKGASTAETVRGLEDRFTMTEAMLHEAETMLGYTEIRAPFDGVVARKLVFAGDLASPGQPLLEVEGTTDFEIEAGVPESLAASLAPGAGLFCTVAGHEFMAVIRELSSTADAATRTVGVKLAVPANASVRSGQFVRIQIPGAGTPTLLVPSTAVSVNGQMERVFVVGANRQTVLRLVKTGGTRGDRTEILSGLTSGEQVVANPPASLREGQQLEAKP